MNCISKPLAIALLVSATAASAGEWITLFDGSSTDNLRGYGREDFPADAWDITEAGELKTNPEGTRVDLLTRERFGNYEIELEWKVTPAGNSGIIYNVAEGPGASYITGPEMQVLDDSRHPDGRYPDRQAGSLYALIKPSDKRVVNPVGEFNRARLVVNQGHVEHWLNGELIVEYDWRSPEIQEGIANSKFNAWADNFMTRNVGHVAIQHHGEEVWYRNIRIRHLDESNNRLSADEKADGWELLFDGQSTDKWRSARGDAFPEKGWAVEGGWLKHLDKAGGGDIVTKNRYEEFIFSWEWVVAPGANSGVKYFVVPERGTSIGHEYQVIDDGAHADALRGAKYQTAAFYDVFPPAEAKTLQPVGDFNRSTIVVEGNHVEHYLNGDLVNEYELGSEETLAAVQKSKFRNTDRFGTRVNGHILLQDHQDEVWYRNLKILDLSD